MRTARIYFGLGIATLFIVLLLRHVSIGEAAHAFILVSPGPFALGCGLIVTAYLVRVRRWQLLLHSAGIDLSYSAVAPVFFAAFALNNVLPLRAGDAYRWVATSSIRGGAAPGVFAALAVERVLVLAVLAALLGLMLILVSPTDVEYANTMLASLAAGVTFCLALLLVAPHGLRLAFARWRSHESKTPLLRWVFDRLAITAGAAESILRGRLIWRLVILTLAAWTLELGIFAVIGFALGGSESLVGGFYAGLLGTLATLIPGAPGHIGTFDFFAAKGFGTAGLDAASAVAAALACHLIVVVPITAIGAIRLIVAPRAASRAW